MGGRPGLRRAHSWAIDPDRRWFARCDHCGRRRLVADYYEVYGNVDADHIAACQSCQDKQRTPGTMVWWWECARCLISTLSSIVESSRGCPHSGG